jgi:hypothetical protein
MGKQYGFYVLGLLTLAVFMGCGSDGEKSLVDPSRSSTAAQTSALPVILPSTNNAASISPPSQQVNAATPSLNPAHGQPGHRCDISVGAPLPDASAPVQPTPTVSAPPTNNPTQVLNIPNSSAGIKINPAHGQPGHRCDIAVGAPIK